MEQNQVHVTDPLMMTFIVDGPHVSAGSFSRMISGFVELLDGIESTRTGQKSIMWGVSNVIAGFSEWDDIQRIAVEFKGECENIDPDAFKDYWSGIFSDLFAVLEAARTGGALLRSISGDILKPIKELATVLKVDVRELWISRAGGSVGYITPDTLTNVNAIPSG